MKTFSANPNPPQAYLGDGVYAEFDGHNIILKVERNSNDLHFIYLEPSVLDALNTFIREIHRTLREPLPTKETLTCLNCGASVDKLYGPDPSSTSLQPRLCAGCFMKASKISSI